MTDGSPVGRAGTPDEMGAIGAFLMGPEGGFVSGSDFLVERQLTTAASSKPASRQTAQDRLPTISR